MGEGGHRSTTCEVIPLKRSVTKQECVAGITSVLLDENCLKVFQSQIHGENQQLGLYIFINNTVSIKQKISSEKYELWELY